MLYAVEVAEMMDELSGRSTVHSEEEGPHCKSARFCIFHTTLTKDLRTRPGGAAR